MRRTTTSILGGVLLVLPVYASAAQPPHTFVQGQPALAAQVNENFAAVAGPATGTIFIAPKEISSGLGANDQAVNLGIGGSFTATFGLPTDYAAGGTDDIVVKPLFSGCLNENILVSVTTNFLNIGTNGDNTQNAPGQEFTMPNDATTIETRNYTRTGLGDINYVTVDRALATANACAVSVSFHGILIEYPR